MPYALPMQRSHISTYVHIRLAARYYRQALIKLEQLYWPGMSNLKNAAVSHARAVWMDMIIIRMKNKALYA